MNPNNVSHPSLSVGCAFSSIQTQTDAPAHANDEQAYAVRTVFDPKSPSPVKRGGTASGMSRLYKKFKPAVKSPTKATVDIGALTALAISSIKALSLSNTGHEQYAFLRDIKNYSARIAGSSECDATRAGSLSEIAQSLSAKLNDQCLHANHHGQALRVLERLMSPAYLERTKFGTFPNIENSRSTLITRNARSNVMADLVQAWPALNDRKKQHVIDLILDQLQNTGASEDKREPLLNFLAKDALPHAYVNARSGAPDGGAAEQPRYILYALKDTVNATRSYQELVTLHNSLSDGMTALEAAAGTTGGDTSIAGHFELESLEHIAGSVFESIEHALKGMTEDKESGFSARSHDARKLKERERQMNSFLRHHILNSV